MYGKNPRKLFFKNCKIVVKKQNSPFVQSSHYDCPGNATYSTFLYHDIYIDRLERLSSAVGVWVCSVQVSPGVCVFRETDEIAKTMIKSLKLPFKVRGQEGVIPALGFGTANLKNSQCVDSVVTALGHGYRLLDTALLYGNQVEVGEGLRKSGVPRDDVWLTSKVAFFPEKSSGCWMHQENNLKGGEAASITLTLDQLKVSHVDLMLIHNPAVGRKEYDAACLPHFLNCSRCPSAKANAASLGCPITRRSYFSRWPLSTMGTPRSCRQSPSSNFTLDTPHLTCVKLPPIWASCAQAMAR